MVIGEHRGIPTLHKNLLTFICAACGWPKRKSIACGKNCPRSRTGRVVSSP